MDENDLAQLITPKEAAKLKEVSVATIYKAVKEGRLKAVWPVGAMAFLLADLDVWQPASYRGVQRAVVTRGIPRKKAQTD
ncbi:hypothetical protein CCAX7_14240 [Capsulimonas corticalis]|uniref:Helix-turn-helix domain-containing protein n=1 Tax=Capsulimonas corticalis TaxID=2219043 RepID=A0A402D747_9BACT|nr:helix-turn-helix domain-containing protein [Capsulimonas corticalis]BDI29373.1 hypothetical protein CCAX7_14240 [Capsulimonas corticalis]